MLTEYSRRTLGAYRHRFHTGQYAARNAPPSAEQRLPSFPCRLERACASDRVYSRQGLELLVTVLLARNRQPPTTINESVRHADFAAELVTLPSGLLAMVCEAIGKLKVRLGGRVCVRAWGCVNALIL